MIDVDRAKVMAYRAAMLGLASRGDTPPADLPLLDLGLQEYTPGSVQVALAARTTAPLDDDRLITVWAARGAPHMHRRTDLAALVQQLWPVSDADASARISDKVKLGISAFTVTATAFREIVTHPMPRGEASTAISRRVPDTLTYDCKGCRARHIFGGIWQHAGLAGGIEVQSRGRDAMLGPIPSGPPQPTANAGIGDLITTYLRFLGPATPAEIGKYLGSTTTEMKKVWPATGLTPLTVDGRKTWHPTTAVDELLSAEPAMGIRLLPAMDPLIQARDRDLLVPSRAHQKAVWRILGNPGVLLVDGEIAGTWRAKLSAHKRVDLTVTPFTPLPATRRKQLDEEATHVARARGVPEATTTLENS